MNVEVIAFMAISAVLIVLLTYGAIIQRRKYRAMTNSGTRLGEFERWKTVNASGISKDVRERLPRMLYDPSTFHSIEPQCAICLIDYNSESELCRLNCDHVFHYLCVDKWLIQHKSCPACRVHVTLANSLAPTESDASDSESRVDTEALISSAESKGAPSDSGAHVSANASDSLHPKEGEREASIPHEQSQEEVTLKVAEFMSKRADLLQHGRLKDLK